MARLWSLPCLPLDQAIAFRVAVEQELQWMGLPFQPEQLGPKIPLLPPCSHHPPHLLALSHLPVGPDL